MNPEESQTPESIEESVVEEQEQSHEEVEHPENFSTSSMVDTQPHLDAEEPPTTTVVASQENEVAALELKIETELKAAELAELQRTEETLKAEIAQLQTSYKSLQTQMSDTQVAMGKIIQESLSGLEQRKQALQIAIEQLERRQERIRNEMRTTFAGVSQDLAIRVQGFKDYLTGSLQDLAASAEQLQLTPPTAAIEREKSSPKDAKPPQTEVGIPQFAQQQFQDTTKQIRRIIEQYRTKPDYYGPAWQLRRTFEPVHAERVSNWFFSQGGRGALRTMNSRLQNILIASAVISILNQLHGDRVRALVLSNTPERLGEWRRGLQDCLGIGRPDFGPDRGVVLFEASDALAIKAERLVKANQLPLIIIDDSEDQISLSLLQFPLWLAFAPDPKTVRNNYDDDY